MNKLLSPCSFTSRLKTDVWHSRKLSTNSTIFILEGFSTTETAFSVPFRVLSLHQHFSSSSSCKLCSIAALNGRNLSCWYPSCRKCRSFPWFWKTEDTNNKQKAKVDEYYISRQTKRRKRHDGRPNHAIEAALTFTVDPIH